MATRQPEQRGPRGGCWQPHQASQDVATEQLDHAGQEEMLGRGLYRKEASIHLRDYVTYIVQKISPSSSLTSIPQHSSCAPYRIAHYVSGDNFSLCHRNFLAALTMEREPVHYFEAMKMVAGGMQ